MTPGLVRKTVDRFVTDLAKKGFFCTRYELDEFGVHNLLLGDEKKQPNVSAKANFFELKQQSYPKGVYCHIPEDLETPVSRKPQLLKGLTLLLEMQEWAKINGVFFHKIDEGGKVAGKRATKGNIYEMYRIDL